MILAISSFISNMDPDEVGERSRKMSPFSPEGWPIACIVLIRIKYILVATLLKGLMTACMSHLWLISNCMISTRKIL